MSGDNNLGGGGEEKREREPYSDSNDPESEECRKLFVGGLSNETTDDGLKAHFEQWGEIEDHVIVKDPQSKRSRGFGFITYTKSHMLDDAQRAGPHNIDGREVEIKRAVPRGNPNGDSSAKEIFIGGMEEGTTEEMIRDVFEKFGAIAKVDMVMDKATGKPKGFCFVEFEYSDSVDKCVLESDSYELNGKIVKVKKTQPNGGEGTVRGGGRGGRGGCRGGRGGGRGGQGRGYDNYGGGYNDGGFGGGYNQGGGYGQGEGYGGGGGRGGYNQ